MIYGLRLRLMALLDHALHRSSEAVQVELIQADEQERSARLGPQDAAVENLRRAVGA